MEIERLNYLTEKAQEDVLYTNSEDTPEAINLAELTRRTEAGSQSPDWEIYTQTKIGDFISIIKKFTYDDEGGKVSVIVNNKGVLNESQYNFIDAFKWHGEGYLEVEERRDPYRAYTSAVEMIRKDEGNLDRKGNIGLADEYKALFEVLHPESQARITLDPNSIESNEAIIKTVTDALKEEFEIERRIEREDFEERFTRMQDKFDEVIVDLGKNHETQIIKLKKDHEKKLKKLKKKLKNQSKSAEPLTPEIPLEEISTSEAIIFEPDIEPKRSAYNGAIKRADGKFASPKDGLTKSERGEELNLPREEKAEIDLSLNIYDLDSGMRIGFPRKLRNREEILIKINEQISLFNPLNHDLGWLEEEVRKTVKNLRSSYTRKMLTQVKLIPPESEDE